MTKLSACIRSSGERNPKVDPKIELFRTCIAAIPRYDRAYGVVLEHFVLNAKFPVWSQVHQSVLVSQEYGHISLEQV